MRIAVSNYSADTDHFVQPRIHFSTDSFNHIVGAGPGTNSYCRTVINHCNIIYRTVVSHNTTTNLPDTILGTSLHLAQPHYHFIQRLILNLHLLLQ